MFCRPHGAINARNEKRISAASRGAGLDHAGGVGLRDVYRHRALVTLRRVPGPSVKALRKKVNFHLFVVSQRVLSMRGLISPAILRSRAESFPPLTTRLRPMTCQPKRR